MFKKSLVVFIFLISSIVGFSQIITDTGSLRTAININLADNTTHQISPLKLRNVINGIANLMKAYAMDSVYLSNDTLVFRRIGFSTFKIKLSTLSSTLDTTSLSNRIDLKLNITDTANNWFSWGYKSNDSLYLCKGNTCIFIMTDSSGAIPTLDQVLGAGNIGTGKDMELDDAFGNPILITNMASRYFQVGDLANAFNKTQIGVNDGTRNAFVAADSGLWMWRPGTSNIANIIFPSASGTHKRDTIPDKPGTFAMMSDVATATTPFTSTTPGIVNAPGTGNSQIFLRWDNTFWPVVIPGDTTSKWVGWGYRSHDSIFLCKGSTCTFAWKDSVGGGSPLDTTGLWLYRANNLSDVTNPGTARTNLGLGTAAVKDVPASGDASGTQVVLGNDSRLTNTRTPTNGSVGNAQMATMPAHSYKGNNTGSTATPTDVTSAQLAADLPAYTTTTPGVLSAPGTATGKVPFDNGTWGNIPYPSILFRYNVVDYPGVDTTGNTANATANRRGIDSCIAAAQRSPYPAAVVFPSGVYAIDSPLINITKALSFEGYNANLKASNSSTFNFFDIKSDSVRIKGLKFFGNTSNQVAINVNGFKYFSITGCDFSNLNKGMRFANTSSTFNAGNIYDCNFYSNIIGLQSDTLGEYVSIFGGLFKSNTTAILDDGGNNNYIGVNVNSNTTAFKFTGGSNNSHGIIANPNGNHNGTSFDVSGASFGETVVGGHFYEGAMTFTNSSNWRFTGGCIISPSTLTITNCANMDFSGASIFSTYGTTRNFSGNINKPVFNQNFGDVASSITTPNGSATPLVDSMGGYGYRSALTGDTLDLGVARWQYKSLSSDDTIKKIIRPTVGRIYRLEIVANGHNFTLLDNTKVSGTFNSSSALNVYNIECIDDGADPRFIVTVSQPGILVSRPTTNLGWGRLTGTGSISGSNITKSGPDALSFTVQAVPDKVLSSGDGYYSCQAISTYGNVIFGLSTNPVQNDYHSINYGIYFFGSSGGANNINIAESGTLISSGLGGTNWSTNDSFRVKVTGTTVTYEKYSGGSWNIFFTSTHAVTTYPLIPQVSIRALTTFTNPKIFGSGVTNNLQSYYAVPYADNINPNQSIFQFTAKNGLSLRTNPDTAIVLGGALDSGFSIQGAGKNGSFGTVGSKMSNFLVNADTVLFNGFPPITAIRGQLETGQTTFKGQGRILAADTYCEAGGYILVNSITTNHIWLEVVFTDPGGTARTIQINPVGTPTTDISTTGYYLFPMVTFRAKSGTTVTVQTNGTSGGSMNYDWEPVIQQVPR